MAITRCAKASQSVPYAINGYARLVALMPSYTRRSQVCSADSPPAGSAVTPKMRMSQPVSRSSGNAVTPLSTRPTMKIAIQPRMRRKSARAICSCFNRHWLYTTPTPFSGATQFRSSPNLQISPTKSF